MTIDTSLIAVLISVVFGVIALVSTLVEFRNKNRLTRIEMYLHLREEYSKDPKIMKVCDALGSEDDDKIRELTYIEKRLFLGTTETVALLVKSGVISPMLAMYMFGHYATVALKSEAFWDKNNNLQSDLPIWGLFKVFAEECGVLKDRFEDNIESCVKNELNFYECKNKSG